MDDRSKKYFDSILAKEPEDLSKEEISFLRARRSYLKKIQEEEYNSVLETKPPKTETVKSNGKTR